MRISDCISVVCSSYLIPILSEARLSVTAAAWLTSPALLVALRPSRTPEKRSTRHVNGCSAMPAPGTLGTGAKPRGLRSSFPIRRKHVDRNQAARWRSCWRSSQGEGRKPSNGREWLSVADPQDVPEIPCEAEANSFDPPLQMAQNPADR